MVNVSRYDSQVDFRMRERGREADDVRWHQIRKKKVRSEVFQAMDAFDRKLAEKERENKRALNGGKLNVRGIGHGHGHGHHDDDLSSDELLDLHPEDEDAKKAQQKESSETQKELQDLHLYRPRPCSPLLHYDYGHASVKPIAFQIDKRQPPKPVSERRFMTNQPCGSQYPNTVMEPIYRMPRLEPIVAEKRGWFEEQPILRHASFSNFEAAKEKALINLFKKEKVSGLKGMTNAYAKSYSFVAQCENHRRVQMAVEAQRIYDATHGVTFKDMEEVHWNWLEDNASDWETATNWLYAPRDKWTDIQKKAWEILSFLYRDLLRNEKKSIRHLFGQTTKKDDTYRTIRPHCSDMAMNLDGARLLRNLEMQGVVNNLNRPSLMQDDMYFLLHVLGGGYDGVISLETMTETVRKFSLVYLQHQKQNLREESKGREKDRQNARAASTEHFIRQHWAHHSPIVSIVK